VTFRDHFSGAAAEYAAFRPRYPAELFAALAGSAPGRELAWDAGTGNGQAAAGLAPYFDRVVATDASRSQIAAARAVERVEFRIAPAEASGLSDGSVDLVTAAQAAHWFDLPAFFGEAARVLRPGGVIAIWSYGLLRIDERIDPVVHEFYHDTLGPWWSPERALVDSGYSTIDFPFAEFALPTVSIDAQLTLDALAGYLRTWSAVLRATEALGADPVTPFIEQLTTRWGPRPAAREVRWPLYVRVGRRPG